jgi:uncharacterized membrane protein YagU involved in acid resistance
VAVDLDRWWRPVAAGLCGTAAHTVLMALKSWAHWLPGFAPYRDLQAMLAAMVGTSVPAAVPWLLSYFNGSVVLGFLYRAIHRRLPGRDGAVKGAVFGLLGWIVMGLVAFPLLGRGLFATQAGLGLKPAFFTLLMMLTYSIVLGVAYAALERDR